MFITLVPNVHVNLVVPSPHLIQMLELLHLTHIPECRICGDFHDEINCPYLTMNDPYGGGHAPEQEPDQLLPEVPRNYADEEDDTIRVKSLNDLVFPGPPENAGQARGYVNQVLMAIGKLQKTPGSEVYQWAQECLTSGEAE